MNTRTRNQERFLNVQSRCVELISRTEILRMVCDTDKRDGDERHRVAGTLAGHLIAYSSERAYAALKGLDKCEAVRPVSEHDYERFVERCTGIAGARGIDVSSVEDSFLRTAEMAINHSEDALVRAGLAYLGEGLDLAKRSNTPKFGPNDAFIARIEREHPEFKGHPADWSRIRMILAGLSKSSAPDIVTADGGARDWGNRLSVESEVPSHDCTGDSCKVC